MRTLWITAFVIFALDQASKWVVVQYLDLKTRLAIDVVPPLLNLRMAWNEGINFGLFSSAGDARRWILIAVALAITVFVVYWTRKENMRGAPLIFAGVLIGGGLGNVIDRLIYGAVADFLNMSCCGFTNPYSFNVADIAVFAGAIGLILFAPSSKSSNDT